MVRQLFLLGLLSISVLLTACITIEENYAPVTEISVIEPIPKKGIHRVLPDETLYSIAWRYGLDYNDLAKLNNIPPPYAITAGQFIYLTKQKPHPKPVVKKTAPIEKSTPKVVHTPPVPVEKEPTARVSHWQWPAKGPVIATFSSLNKGVNIAGHRGDPIYATAAGKIVYSGHGLRGYGNLIIIKHNSVFLTAYAHNYSVLVKEGDWVKAGQKIADMGSSGTQRVMLHFEIRRHGKPVNPLLYLGKHTG